MRDLRSGLLSPKFSSGSLTGATGVGLRRPALWALGALAALGVAALGGCGSESPPAGGADAAADTAAPGDTTPGDGVAPTDTKADAPVAPGAFGAPCGGNADCDDGWCVDGANGHQCTRTCQDDCPDGYACRSALVAEGQTVFLCLPQTAALCTPCAGDIECPGGACLELDGRGMCAPSCGSEQDCPSGYTCAPDPGSGAEGAREGTWCQPKTGSCTCSEALAGTKRTCAVTNDIGTCLGEQTCDPVTGWSACSAREATAEVCDGEDNDCDALIDEALSEGATCVNEVAGVGACEGVQVCGGAAGMICQAPTPQIETCDFQDNDCDGLTDEDFADAQGVMSYDSNCGSCGNDCTKAIAHGTGRCDASGATPVCVVASCDDDYVQINPFQCALPPDVSCQPCTGDEDCLGGSCIELDGQQVCASPCSGTTQSCQEGYACQDVGGAPRCVPVTASCVCGPAVDGLVRTCAVTNAAGTCFGQETCDAASGWQGCSAATPAAETCNGLDDDCNGLVDDDPTPPADPCENTNAEGTCEGAWTCGPDADGVAQWSCEAPTPAPEVCDLQDNDCDGETDEGFRDPTTGLYVDDANCGACGVSCEGAIPNATAHCVVSDGTPRCEVASCNPGSYQAGPLTCVTTAVAPCTPCSSDEACLTPGDRCLPLDGGTFCTHSCAAGNAHGTPEGQCPNGYTCQDVSADASGDLQCVPTSGSCSCLPPQDGATRTCTVTNALGTCFGTQQCDATSGWSPCTASTPAVESCNGVDDDCSGVIDDVPGRGDPCQVSNALGQCDGVLACVPGEPALQCAAPTPAAETCDHLDNDCDGETDEDFPTLGAACEAGEGACHRYGVFVCAPDGGGVVCDAVPGPQTVEVCDDLDNDCDGETDELFPDKGTPCAAGVGACQVVGVRQCNQAGDGTVCGASPKAGTQEICDGIDNDCNGETDELFTNLGDVCFAGQGACRSPGTRKCAPDGLSTVCDAIPGDPGPMELCNNADDDCDGDTDEGYRDPVTGKYDADSNCGSCFTNCLAIYAKPHAYGACDATDTPVCVMQCDDGYFDLNGVPDDGCEFHLDPGAVYVSATDPAAADNAACGDAPSVTGAGFPCATIGQGLVQATNPAKVRVLVAAGSYEEIVTLADGVNLLGGYNATTWKRDWDANPTVLAAPVGTGHRKTVIASKITAPTVFQGFVVYGTNALTEGRNSYGVYIYASDDSLEIRDNVIFAGDGAPGQRGQDGVDGADGADGAPGSKAREIGPHGTAATTAGGSGGVGVCGAITTSGGNGGDAVAPPFEDLVASAQPGTKGANNFPGAGVAGSPGTDGATSAANGEVCAVCHLTTGFMEGTDGGDGGDGTSGVGGLACSTPGGSVFANEWIGIGGGPGAAGDPGGGGGGGGAGGGSQEREQNVCWDDLGASGGGGGAGGCGGTRGEGGGSGGGSFGIFVYGCASPPKLVGNTIYRGFGGDGGDGGQGGTGGAGGAGAPGGAKATSSTDFCTGPGGAGGDGGRGGHGGGGGGGCGGASFGIWAGNYGVGVPTYDVDNSFPPSGAAGKAGRGGASLGSDGADGQNGDYGTARF